MVVNFKNGSKSIYDRTPTLKRYFDDIKKYQVLTKEEEMALFSVYKNGSKEESKRAKEKLINSNQRFIVAVARRYGNNGNLLDLIEEANLAVLEALNSFDPSQDVKFTSWAVWFIRRAINMYNVNYGEIVKKNNIAKTYHLIAKATHEFTQREKREPTSEELFNLLNDTYNAKLKNSQDVTPTRVDSIDECYGASEEDVNNIGAMSLYNSYSASLNEYEKKENDEYVHTMVSSFLNILTPREQEVIKMAFGIGYFREYENQEIAEKIGITTERVRQMRSSIVERLAKEHQKHLKIMQLKAK